MSEPHLDTATKILGFSAVVEVATGLVLMTDPALAIALLLGGSGAGEQRPLGRFIGIALLALGVACWPGRRRTESGSPAFRGMLIYDGLIALFLAWLGAVEKLAGVLLWPAVALHAVVGLLLLWTWRERRIKAASDRSWR